MGEHFRNDASTESTGGRSSSLPGVRCSHRRRGRVGSAEFAGRLAAVVQLTELNGLRFECLEVAQQTASVDQSWPLGIAVRVWSGLISGVTLTRPVMKRARASLHPGCSRRCGIRSRVTVRMLVRVQRSRARCEEVTRKRNNGDAASSRHDRGPNRVARFQAANCTLGRTQATTQFDTIRRILIVRRRIFGNNPSVT